MDTTHTTKTTTQPASLATSFEKQTCGRCGGSGSYSWNARTGSTCFDCGGKGEHLTKRGAAAAAHMTALRSRPATELTPGTEIWVDGFPGTRGSWRTVTAVRPSPIVATLADGRRVSVGTEITCGGDYGMHVADDCLVRVRCDAAAQASTLAAALAYQATLTKAGKPRAR